MSTAQTAGVLTAAGSASVAASYGVTLAIDEGTTEQEPEEQTPKIPPEPEFKTLKLAQNSTYPEKTLAHKEDNKSNLVDIKLAENNNWWTWSFENKFSKEKEKNKWRIHGVFSNVTTGYEAFEESIQTTKTSLNYACHKAYNMKWYHFYSTNNLLNNVKLFCTNSLTGQKIVEPEESEPEAPVLLKDKNNELSKYNSKLGNKNNNKDLFVSPVGTDQTSNEDWWQWKYKKYFLKKDLNKNEINIHFRSVKWPYSTSPSGDVYTRTSLNFACEAAYEKDPTGITEEMLQKNIEEFCAHGVTNAKKVTFK